MAPRRPPGPRPHQAGIRRILRHPRRLHRQLQSSLPSRHRLSRSLRGHRTGDCRGRILPRHAGPPFVGIHRKNKERPFFLYTAFNLPHYPEQAPERFTRLYADAEDEKLRSYGPVISTLDHHIGLILDQLDRLGLTDNTIVIFMSDNGHSEETFMRIGTDDHRSGLPQGHFYAASGVGNTGKWIGHKSTFLEGGIRVPAILRFPGKVPANEVRDQIVTVMDWFPTVLEFCGIQQPDDAPPLDGHSLLPVLRDAAAPDAYGGVLNFAWRGGWAVRDGEWKLIGGTRWRSEERGLTLHRLTDE